LNTFFLTFFPDHFSRSALIWKKSVQLVRGSFVPK
jgi:hypothetical protein